MMDARHTRAQGSV